MVHSTPLDRPAQALKYLVEKLIEVSLNKDKLLELIEVGFGARIFNKAKDKVVKKVSVYQKFPNMVISSPNMVLKVVSCLVKTATDNETMSIGLGLIGSV